MSLINSDRRLSQMSCPVAKVQPAGWLIGTTVLPGTQSDKRQNMQRRNRAIRVQPSRSHFIPLYLFLLPFLPLSLASVSKHRSWKDFLSTALCFVFTATFCGEAQSPSDCCWCLTHFILSKVPCDWRKGTIAVSCWVWLRLNPGSSLCSPIQQEPHSAEEH